MGSLVSVLLALGVLTLREYGVTSGIVAGWAALPLYFLPYLPYAFARAALLRGRFAAAERWQRAAALFPGLAFAAAVCGFGWVEMLERWSGGRLSFFEWPRLAVLLVFVPLVLYELAGIDARARLASASAQRRSRLRAFGARMFFASLLPLGAYVVLSAAVGANEHLRIRIEEIGAWHALFAALLLVLLVLLLPFLLAFALDTTRIPEGPLRALFEAVARAAKFRAREILVWNTGGNMANAAIVGLGARTRIVLFSDALLAQLEPRELASVYAHEIAHARGNHVPIFVAWVLAFFLGGDLVAQALFPANEWLAGGTLLASLALWYFFFGWLSRRYELEADLYAIALLGDPAAMISALERVGGALRDLAGWRHFSTARRVAFLERTTREPGLSERFRARLRRWSILGVALFLVSAAFEGRRLAQDFGGDCLRANLRLGEYAAAQVRVRELPELGPELRKLVVRAGSIGHDVADAGELEQLARAALTRDDAQAALEYLQLGALRGRADLGHQAAELAARLGAGPPQ
ncbi:MAG: M48 family metalloprotease [Planctomycetes bacterium]|nr:M48 family metalloprotease [Planctomycetota bacterium]